MSDAILHRDRGCAVDEQTFENESENETTRASSDATHIYGNRRGGNRRGGSKKRRTRKSGERDRRKAGRRIACTWGLSHLEIPIASEAAHWMERKGGNLWNAVIADSYRPEREVRELVRRFKNKLVQAQREAGTEPYWLDIGEGRPAYHANIIFPLHGPKGTRLVERLRNSPLFPGDVLLIQRTYGVHGLIGYLAKERTPQAAYIRGLRMKKRLRGSHPLGEGGGDRVRLSKALYRDLVAAERIAPWQRVYARRSLPKPAGAA